MKTTFQKIISKLDVRHSNSEEIVEKNDANSESHTRQHVLHSKERGNEIENSFIQGMAQTLRENNSIDDSFYGKYDVKRGLRDSNGAGVIVGLTKIGDVQGYDVNENNEKVAIDGKLFYRGIDVEDLVENCVKENRFGYEEASYLLLFGVLPTPKALEAYKTVLGLRRDLPKDFTRDMILTAPSNDIMNKLARSVLALYSYDKNADDISIENVLRQSINLIACLPTLIAYGYQAKRSSHHNESLFIHHPDPNLSTAENILKMIRPDGKYTDMEAKLLDLSMILHAEHGGGNNSSFTIHVVSSTGTDTYSAVSAAVGSLKGPKHGGANIEVIQMVADIKKNVSDITDYVEVEKYLIKILKGEANDKSGLIYGLGHAVYTVSDPRAILLKKMAQKLAETSGIMDDFMLYDFIEKRAPSLFREVKKTKVNMPANVDLYSGFVYSALNIPTDIATPIFAAARISGWCAHRIEELIGTGKIMRPAYKCVQPHLKYQTLYDREERNVKISYKKPAATKATK